LISSTVFLVQFVAFLVWFGVFVIGSAEDWLTDIAG
jgi:hypothetical protein